MDLKEKELLLKDLSARLPYGVMLNIKGQDGPKLFDFDENLFDIFLDGNYLSINSRGSGDNPGICEIKPYLRSMSSMTEEEIKELSEIDMKRVIFSSRHLTWHLDGEIIDYLNKKMFDWRGLIHLNLALAAPKGMYK